MRWEDSGGCGYLYTDVYGEPIFSFDYSTRANVYAPRHSFAANASANGFARASSPTKIWKHKTEGKKMEEQRRGRIRKLCGATIV